MLSSQSHREHYVGNNTTDTYDYSFYISDQDQLIVEQITTLGVRTILDIGTDYTVTGVGEEAGGDITLTGGNLPTGYELNIYRDVPEIQETNLRNQGPYFPAVVEAAFDYITMILQWHRDVLNRAMRLPDKIDTEDVGFNFDMSIPEEVLTTPDITIVVNPTATGFAAGPTGTEISNAQQAALDAIAAAAAAEAALAAAQLILDEIEAAGPFDDSLYGFTGFSARFSEAFATTTLLETLQQIIDITYTPPTVSLSASGSGTIREKGTAVTSSNLSATVTKRSDPIAAVRFYLNAVLINTVGSPNPAGGIETYSWSGSFSDTPATFSVQVDDDGSTGGPTTVTDSVAFTFVYPYYVGAGAAGLTPAQVAALTKRVITSTASRTETIVAANSDVFYFAYPASYGALTSILDINGFETFPDWTLTTANITGLDGNPVSYRIYEFNNPVAAGSYQYTFIR